MPKAVDTCKDLTESQRHAWILWLMGEDAQTLLWTLCTDIEDPTVSREALTARVRLWQKNAQRAVGAHSWSVRLDPRVGICLDQRLFHFDMRKRVWTHSTSA